MTIVAQAKSTDHGPAHWINRKPLLCARYRSELLARACPYRISFPFSMCNACYLNSGLTRVSQSEVRFWFFFLLIVRLELETMSGMDYGVQGWSLYSLNSEKSLRCCTYFTWFNPLFFVDLSYFVPLLEFFVLLWTDFLDPSVERRCRTGSTYAHCL